MKHSVTLTGEQAREMLSMDEKSLRRAGEEIAVREGYHPAGYGFFNPRVVGNTFKWETLDCCD